MFFFSALKHIFRFAHIVHSFFQKPMKNMTKEAKLSEYLLRLRIYTSTKYIQNRIEKEVGQKSQATGNIIEFKKEARTMTEVF